VLTEAGFIVTPILNRAAVVRSIDVAMLRKTTPAPIFAIS
jgi:hypothetical protein